jgi:hypothetical protein
VSGGTSPYTYNWSTGSDSTSADSLSSTGSPYTLTITDANGCETVSCYFIQSAEIPCTYVTSDVCGDTLPLNTMNIQLKEIAGASFYRIMLIDTSDTTDTVITRIPSSFGYFHLCHFNDTNYNISGTLVQGNTYQVWTQTIMSNDSSDWCWKDSCIIIVEDYTCPTFIINNSDPVNPGKEICGDTVYRPVGTDPNYIRITPHRCNVWGYEYQVIEVGSGDPDGNIYYRNHNSFPLNSSYGITNSGSTYRVILRTIKTFGDTIGCNDTCEFVYIDTLSGSLLRKGFKQSNNNVLSSSYQVAKTGENLKIKEIVSGTSPKQATKVDIYHINGQLLNSFLDVDLSNPGTVIVQNWNKLKHGVYVVNITYSDGTFHTEKVTR